MIVQLTRSPLCTLALETNLITSKSAIGTGSIVRFTVLLVPLGPTIVRLLVNFSIEFTYTCTVIIAREFAVMLVIVQVITCPFSISLINFAPVTFTVPKYFNPSGKLSITVNSLM